MTPHHKKRSPDKIFHITRLKYYGKPYDSIYSLSIPLAWLPNILAIALGTFIGIKLLGLKPQKVEAMIDPYISSSNVSPTPIPCPTSVVLRQEIVSYIRCKDWDSERAIKIVECESNFNTEAIHVNRNGTVDRGAWQLNSIHKGITSECAFNLKCATDASFNIYLKQGFSPWNASRKCWDK